jgi:hypothetical protein
LPSYTGQFRAKSTGNYSLAVLHLEGGGLNAKYYGNQRLLDDPLIQQVDPTINFHWSLNIITHGFIDVEGHNISVAIAGDRTSFYLQARDASGNNKLTNGDAQGDLQSPEEHFTVNIVADHGSVLGKVTYLDSGKYCIDFSVL